MTLPLGIPVCDACHKYAPTWDPEGVGQERCETCLTAAGWEYDGSDEDRDGRWRGGWTRREVQE
jgi:hypothetical protein